MSAIGYIAGAVAMAAVFGTVALWAGQRRDRDTGNGVRRYPHGGEMGDLKQTPAGRHHFAGRI